MAATAKRPALAGFSVTFKEASMKTSGALHLYEVGIVLVQFLPDTPKLLPQLLDFSPGIEDGSKVRISVLDLVFFFGNPSSRLRCARSFRSRRHCPAESW